MIIGVPKETKHQETRVGLTPKWVKLLIEQGHIVYVERNLGLNANINDKEYISVGAEVIESVEQLYRICDFIVKIKDFTDEEAKKLPFRENQIIMTFLHLGENDPHPNVVDKLVNKKIKGIGLELIRDDDGVRTVIKPMSQIAGKLSVMIAAYYSQMHNGGRGISLTSIEGIKPAKILILGGGNSGKAAIETSIALGNEVVVFQKKGKTFDDLKKLFPEIKIIPWDRKICMEEMKTADVLINAIYPTIGMETPLITRKMLRQMEPRSVLIDLAGCGIIETWRFTSIDDPVFVEENILHYGVDNIPSLIPETSCEVFCSSIFKYVESIANKGFERACMEDESLKRGVCFYDGKVVDKDVAYTHDMQYHNLVLRNNEDNKNEK